MRFAPWLRAGLALTAVAGLATCGEEEAPPAVDRPNVILLVIDTLRADHLHGYGYPRQTSPTLDRLMAEGVRCDASIASSSWSAPSHTSIVTGTDAPTHRVLNFAQRVAIQVDPLAVPLKEAGYATGLFSTHFALHTSVERLDEGIDEKLVKKNEFDAEVLDAAADWALDQDDPFFLYMVMMGPHAKYDKYPPGDDEKYFTDMPPGGEKTYPFTEGVWVGEGGIPQSVRLGDEQRVGVYVNRYDRAIRYTDQLLGQFLQRLEEAGALDDTLIVITSDHGEGLGDHDCFAHELYLYDFLVRVPLIFHWPGEIPGGQVREHQVPSIDIMPTVLGLLDRDVPDFVEGRDLSASLRSGVPPEQPVLAFSSYRNRGHGKYMVRSRQHKLILDARDQSEEYYDLVADPTESRNLRVSGGPTPPDYDRLAEAMLDSLSAHTAIGRNLVPVTMSAEVIEELRKLGYLPPAPAKDDEEE